MRNNKGITLMSLVLYIAVMVIVIGVMSAILSDFYNNNNTMQEDTEDILEFNKFNTYFLKEIKSFGNSVDSIDEDGNYILFTSGNSFSFSNNKIYYNTKEICNGVESVNIAFRKSQNDEGEEIEDKTIIDINFKLKKFNKVISYTIEDIY